ncbi:ATP-binding cassette domain-containing protein [Agrilactobacillus yilanensis]|uniref:ATP-binding cassette domain-containing protein n=1 Tax=Agrilactobacillus yilanensis TaxID=2485997 RepID=A0ABW4J457_9LACO|nr:ATP-binding cassette domain-containing protein [Agrilactobacillus yilanensis]
MLKIDIQKMINKEPLHFKMTMDQQFYGLMGSSGCGKTTILRIIAGLAQPDAGIIEFDEQVWLDTAANISLPPEQRHIGFMFQSLALFPNMTTKQNIDFYRRTKVGKTYGGVSEAVAQQLVTTLGLTPLMDQMVTRLSGGQRQRVALCRALVQQPKLLLLDEPFTGLDDDLRQKTMQLTREVLSQTQTQVIIVSHRKDEILAFTDNIYGM